jgi:CelD/BcsL family acetyltransferase involved in cellulose biosynthesis
MRIEAIDRWPAEPAERAGLRHRWEALLERADCRSVFQTFDWHEAWWLAFGADSELVLLLVHDAAGELQAIAPLMIEARRRAGITRRRLLLLGTANAASDYADLIVARGNARARRAIREWIAAQRERWSSVELLNLPESSPTLALLDDLLPRRRALRQVAAEAPARLLGDAAADRRMLAKKSLRRHLNGFSREGRVEFRRLQTPLEVECYLDVFFEQHVRRWAGTDSPSPFGDPAQQRFYRLLAERMDAGATLHFSVVLFEDRPIAFHFGFEHDGVFVWYKPSFEPSLQRRSPGEVLIRCLLEDAVTRGLREFDFTVGSEAFKYRFANVVRRVWRVRLYRRAVEYLPALARAAARRLLAGLRRRSLTPSRSGGPSAEGTHPVRSA